MDQETLQALIEVYRARASADLLAFLIDEAEGSAARASVLSLLRAVPHETFFTEEFAHVRRKACQFFLEVGDFELAERLTRSPEQPEDKVMRARALHGLGRDADALLMYRQALTQDPAARNRELERVLGMRAKLHSTTPPAKVISISNYSSKRESGSESPRSGAPSDASLDDFDYGAVTFNDVAGLDAVKAEIRQRIILPYLKPSLFERYRQGPGGSLLLYGPPGCGKTLIARATAGESDARFLSVSPEEILDKYAGEAEKRLRVFFEEARSDPPAILFFDDLHVLAFKRETFDPEAAPALIPVMLSELDGTSRNNSGVLVLAATNTPWALDPAFLGAGRFQRAMYIGAPAAQARKQILSAASAKVPGHAKLPLDRIMKRTEGFSGADLKALADWVNHAALTKVLAGAPETPVTSALYQEGLKAFGASTQEWLALARTKLKPLQHIAAFQAIFSTVFGR
jgi:transitional endoplasmic reticulum ATPase